MMGPLLRMLVLAIALAAASSHLRALDLAEPMWDLEVLRGLSALHVVVRPLPGDAAKAGISRDLLEQDIQLRLRREGITVLAERPGPVPDTVPQAEAPPAPEWGVLRLNFDDIRRDPNPDGYHEYWLQLELLQDAQLASRPAIKLAVPTWSREATGTHRESRLAIEVREALRLSLDDWIRDYRTINGPDGRLPPMAAEAADATEPEPEGD